MCKGLSEKIQELEWQRSELQANAVLKRVEYERNFQHQEERHHVVTNQLRERISELEKEVERYGG